MHGWKLDHENFIRENLLLSRIQYHMYDPNTELDKITRKGFFMTYSIHVPCAALAIWLHLEADKIQERQTL